MFNFTMVFHMYFSRILTIFRKVLLTFLIIVPKFDTSQSEIIYDQSNSFMYHVTVKSSSSFRLSELRILPVSMAVVTIEKWIVKTVISIG